MEHDTGVALRPRENANRVQYRNHGTETHTPLSPHFLSSLSSSDLGTYHIIGFRFPISISDEAGFLAWPGLKMWPEWLGWVVSLGLGRLGRVTGQARASSSQHYALLGTSRLPTPN